MDFNVDSGDIPVVVAGDALEHGPLRNREPLPVLRGDDADERRAVRVVDGQSQDHWNAFVDHALAEVGVRGPNGERVSGALAGLAAEVPSPTPIRASFGRGGDVEIGAFDMEEDVLDVDAALYWAAVVVESGALEGHSSLRVCRE